MIHLSRICFEWVLFFIVAGPKFWEHQPLLAAFFFRGPHMRCMIVLISRIKLVIFVSPHSPTWSERGASMSLRFVHMSQQYCTIPRNFLNSLTLLGGFIVRIACTFFCWGFIPPWPVCSQGILFRGYRKMTLQHWLSTPHHVTSWRLPLVFLSGLLGFL